jgi:glucose-induced degradation protein 8
MTLVIFPHDSLDPQLAAILNPGLRREVAETVNRAILQRLADRRESAIRELVHTRTWSEDRARETGTSVPDAMEHGLDTDDGDRSTENGVDYMVTT